MSNTTSVPTVPATVALSNNDVYRDKYEAVTKLTEINYRQWHKEIEVVLKSYNLLDIVLRNEKAPTTSTDSDSSTSSSSSSSSSSSTSKAQPTSPTRHKHRFEVRQSKAASIIYATLSDRIKFQLSKISDPADVWETLEKWLSAQKNNARAIRISNAFKEDRIKDTESVNEFLG
ncbi:hypothetical protein BDZ91DRAFT_795734 [Kalaharituber pfeilii]|nr:hypothetical protein BDZ91DRAFT_795734 [Kalaharituber pfeilii]